MVRTYLLPTPVGVGVRTSPIWAVDQTLSRLPRESGYARLESAGELTVYRSHGMEVSQAGGRDEPSRVQTQELVLHGHRDGRGGRGTGLRQHRQERQSCEEGERRRSHGSGAGRRPLGGAVVQSTQECVGVVILLRQPGWLQKTVRLLHIHVCPFFLGLDTGDVR